MATVAKRRGTRPAEEKRPCEATTMMARARPTEAQVREGGSERFSRDGEAVVIDPAIQRLNGEGGVAGFVRWICRNSGGC
ncbi:ATP-binding protein [Sesbania bispinosa]|nr:ATP-binding protein [Sesbania bispinosa]